MANYSFLSTYSYAPLQRLSVVLSSFVPKMFSTLDKQGSPLSDFSVDVRILWAKGRATKRKEDAAYSLLGIFDISMPQLYGEGQEKAMARLRKEIAESLKYSKHEDALVCKEGTTAPEFHRLCSFPCDSWQRSLDRAIKLRTGM